MLNVLSLFSGIGAFEKALDNCHIPYNLVNYEDFYKAEAVNSNTQLYKQAGNSIVVKVLEALYKSLGDTYGEFKPT